jgi:hypothetical protein
MPGTIDVNGTSYKLNCQPSTPDFHNWQFHLRDDLISAPPPQIDLHPWFTYDQLAEGSCTANANIKLIRMIMKALGIPDVDLSRAMEYFDARLLEGTQTQDSGATIGDSIKALATYGVCPESEFPYIVGDYAHAPSGANYLSALNHKAQKYESVALTHDLIGTALSMGHPVSVGLGIYASFETTGANGIVPAPSGALLGGHNLLLTGWDLLNMPDYYIADNSWGPGWGATIGGCPGRCWIPRAWIENPNIAFEAATIDLVNGVPTPPPPPGPGPTPTPVNLSRVIANMITTDNHSISKQIWP